MPEVDLELYRLITVSGTDAHTFLQGQLTQDVTRLKAADNLRAAWCNPKGRVIATLQLVSDKEAIGMIVAENICDTLVRRLSMYRLRADVTLEVDRSPWDAFIDRSSANLENLIAAGVPLIDAENSETFTPHMLNLDRLGAISFSKGCYTGQEVVARTENLGKSKRRIMRYLADRKDLNVGTKVTDGDRSVGEIVNVAGRQLLAVTPVDLHDSILESDGARLTPQSLPYALT